jgi:hypothetical protein
MVRFDLCVLTVLLIASCGTSEQKPKRASADQSKNDVQNPDAEQNIENSSSNSSNNETKPEPKPTEVTTNPSIPPKSEPSSTSSSSPTPEPTPAGLEATLESIQAEIVDKRCVSCHARATRGNRFIDLKTLGTNIAMLGSIEAPVPNEARKSILAGCPNQSIFYLEMKNRKMPTGRNAVLLTDAELEVIAAWIKSLDPTAEGRCDAEPE